MDLKTFRCPKHDKLFQAKTPPNQHGHAKCPLCNPDAAKQNAEAPSDEPEQKLITGKD